MLKFLPILFIPALLCVLTECAVNETIEIGEDDLCPICYEKMNNHEENVKLTCTHELCLSCWVNCFMQDISKCPICRNPNLQNFLSNFTHSFLIMKILHNKTFSNIQLSQAFHKFVSFGNLGICEFLLQNYKIDVNIKDDLGYSVIDVLVLFPKISLNKKFEFFKYLQTNANVYIFGVNAMGQNVLHHAAFMNQIDLVIHLVDHEHFFVHEVDDNGNGALMHALHSKTTDETQILKLIKILVEKYGADFYVENHENISPIYVALHSGYFTIFEYFEQKMNFEIKQNYFYKKKFLHGVLMNFALGESEKLSALQFLISKINLNTKVTISKGYNLLHTSALLGHQKIMTYLSEFIDPNLIDFDGHSVIDFVFVNSESENKKIEMLKFLVEEKNANVNYKHFMGMTIFQTSLFLRFSNVTKYLLKNTNLNTNDTLFEILFTRFLPTEDEKIQHLQYLFEKQSKIDLQNIKNERGETVLHVCAKFGFKKIINFLLENTNLSLVNTRDVRGNCAFFYIISSPHLDKDEKWDILHYYVNRLKVNWNLVRDDKGRNLLHFSLQDNLFSITDGLLAKTNLDINAPDIFGDTPLASLLYSPIEPIVKSLSLKFYVTHCGGKVSPLIQNKKLMQFLINSQDHHRLLYYLWYQEKEEMNI